MTGIEQCQKPLTKDSSKERIWTEYCILKRDYQNLLQAQIDKLNFETNCLKHSMFINSFINEYR